ncbi:hypothetical protein [Streptomyces flaveus]|nr:hypothetical protein [Streptomyces flaveus]
MDTQSDEVNLDEPPLDPEIADEVPEVTPYAWTATKAEPSPTASRG